MDAGLNLKLRRPERTSLSRNKLEDKQDQRREHIKEIIISQFIRRFRPKTTDVQRNFEAEKVIHDETLAFVALHKQNINSKDLHTFEIELARKLGWNKESTKMPLIKNTRTTQSLPKLEQPTKTPLSCNRNI